jgi:hypothetical protein
MFEYHLLGDALTPEYAGALYNRQLLLGKERHQSYDCNLGFTLASSAALRANMPNSHKARAT